MGRGHGSGRGTSAKAGGFQGDRTMKGYSAGLAKAMTAREKEIRGEGLNEKASVFDDEGNELFRNEAGNAKSVIIDRKISRDHVVTHSHPYDRSLSDTDVMNAIIHNEKEVRAVSPTHTYSMKRPSSGWGVENRLGKQTEVTMRGVERYNASIRKAQSKYKKNSGKGKRRNASLFQEL